MPEVCEITLTAQVLEHYLVGKEIKSVKIIGGRYLKNEPAGFANFVKNLPLKINKVSNKGKFMWFELSNSVTTICILNTFGLTGFWGFSGCKHISHEFVTDDLSFCFCDMRNFGTIVYGNRSDVDVKLKELAPDFLKSSDWKINDVKKIDKPIVKILMDQKKIGSGIGNYLVAEILYRAKISPHRTGVSLTDTEIINLSDSIKLTVKLAYLKNDTGYMKAMADVKNVITYKNYHPDVNVNGEFEFLCYGRKFDDNKNEVIVSKIIPGRSTYWVPAIQK